MNMLRRVFCRVVGTGPRCNPTYQTPPQELDETMLIAIAHENRSLIKEIRADIHAMMQDKDGPSGNQLRDWMLGERPDDD
jgi:hypothetical protein